MAHILDDPGDYGVSLCGRRDGGRRTRHFLHTLGWPAGDRTAHDGAIWYGPGFLYQEYAGQLCYCLLQTTHMAHPAKQGNDYQWYRRALLRDRRPDNVLPELGDGQKWQASDVDGNM